MSGTPEPSRPSSPDLTTAFQPLAPGFVADPYPIYRQLRTHDPVHRSHMGYWVLTRYDDVLEALRDPRLSNQPSPYAVVNSRNRSKYTAAQVAGNILPFLDPPRHTAPRRLVAKAFHQHFANSPVDVRAIALDLLQRFEGTGQLELLQDFATPLSVAVIGRMLGIPTADHDQVAKWSNWFFYLFSVIPSQEVLTQLNGALDEFRAYVRHQIDLRRSSPSEDLMSRLLHVREGEHQLTEAELVDTCMLLFADGVENVDSGIANAVLAILTTPGVAAALRAAPERIPQAVEESLRLEAPGQFIAKVAKEDIHLRGQTIRTHDAVLLCLAAANRDPEVFTNPDEFRLDRDGGQHLAFGKGPHGCIGAPLVKLEMSAAIAALLDSFPSIEVATHTPEWEPRLGHRWLQQLPLNYRRGAHSA